MRPDLRLAIIALLAAGPIAASDRILLGTAGANAGATSVLVPVSLTNDRAIHGFSLALAYDPGILTLKSISDEGTVTAALSAEFFHPTINTVTGKAILGVIFSYSYDSQPYGAIELAPSPEEAQRVAILNFDVAPNAPPGDYPIELVDHIGSPPVSNVFTIAGTSIHPAFQDGNFQVNNENILQLSRASATPDSMLELKASGKHPAILQGFSMALTYDTTVLTFVDATLVGTDAAISVQPQTIELFIFQTEDIAPGLSRVSLGAVADFTSPFMGQEIPASPDRFQSLARFRFRVPNDPALIGQSTEVKFHQGDVMQVSNSFIIGLESYVPAFIDAKVTFILAPKFRRGYANSDNHVDISDSIFLLTYLFLGGEPPLCFASTDVNDDSRFDLSDPISLFGYLFLGGLQPKEPFDSCGIDPTPLGSLPCQESRQCP